MEVFVVGGAIRDILLNRSCKDIDFVVVGSTPEEMISNGFKQVGADFPVFLHPETGNEYALARVERKTAPGYNGFECQFDATNTINPKIFQIFIDLGYDPNQEYEWAELMAVFQHITQ